MNYLVIPVIFTIVMIIFALCCIEGKEPTRGYKRMRD
jgi:hypothetical protein